MSKQGPRDPEATWTVASGKGVLEPGMLLAERYRILEVVGRGGMGMVYRAFDEQLSIDVAIKVLLPERATDAAMVERFRHELLLARQVSHPNVVRIHDIGHDGGTFFLSMDYFPGRSLFEILERDGRFSPERAATIGEQLAAALAAAHEQGVIHRDLKPANILLDAQDRPAITDFGVARSLSSSGLTMVGRIIGTPDYFSPEQARGQPVDHRSDLYALGLVLFEMLAGQPAFPGASFEEVLAQRISGRPRRLGQLGVAVPPRLRAVIERCLEHDPARRFTSAREVGNALAASRRPTRRRFGLLQLRRAAVAVLPPVLLLLGVGVWRAFDPGAEPVALPAQSVAVLPLRDETGRGDLAWAGSGLAEMLARDLAESPSLKVADSLRVFRTLSDLRLPPGPLPEQSARQVGELLDVEQLVVGRLLTAGPVVEVEGQLVRLAPSGVQGERFEIHAARGDFNELARRLGEVVRQRLAVPAATLAPPPLTSSPTALEAYSQGIQHLSQGATLDAVEDLEAALAQDPTMIAAWVRLADAYRRQGRGDEAREAIRRAVMELPPDGGRLAYEARARQAWLAGDLDRARHTLVDMGRRYPQDVETQLALGEAYGDQGAYREAVEILESVVVLEPHHPLAWFLLGKFAILSGQPGEAASSHLVRALVLNNRLGNEQGRADVINALGIAFQDLGELDEAAARFQEAVAIRRRIGDQRGVASTLTNLAYLEMRRGNDDGALRSLQEGLEIHRALGNPQGMAEIHNILGTLEEERGRYAKALEMYRRALQLRTGLGDKRALAESLNNVGFSYYLLGQYDHAGVYWEQALTRYRENENPEGVVIGLQSLGLLAIARGNWRGALEAFLEALEISRQLPSEFGQAVSLGNLGRIAQVQGRYRASLDSYDQALSILQPLGDPRGLSEVALQRSSALLELGRVDEADRALDEVEGWQHETGNAAQQAELARLQGLVALARGDQGPASRRLERARELTRSGDHPVGAGRVELSLSSLDLARGNTAAAVTRLRRLRQQAQLLGDVPLQLQVASLLAEAELAAGDPEAAAAAAQQGLQLALDHGPVAASLALHQCLARALEAQGDPDTAARETAAAQRDLGRQAEGLGDDERRALDEQAPLCRTGAEVSSALMAATAGPER